MREGLSHLGQIPARAEYGAAANADTHREIARIKDASAVRIRFMVKPPCFFEQNIKDGRPVLKVAEQNVFVKHIL
jgi:hypothetical protein